MADLSHLSDDQLAQIAGSKDSPPPQDLSHLSDVDLQKIANPSISNSIKSTFNYNPDRGVLGTLADNAKSAINYNPSKEEIMNAAKTPITGMEDPAYTIGVGMTSPNSAIKGLQSLLQSGKAKITGLLSSEHGLHPIIEAAEEAAPAAEAAAKHSGGILGAITHHMQAIPMAAGGYAGHKAAEELGLPGEAGAMAGMAAGAAGPMAVKAFMKTAQGLIPVMETYPAIGSALRAGYAAKKASEVNK